MKTTTITKVSQLIKAISTPAELDEYVHNIMSVWFEASDEDLAEGQAWYRTARGICEQIVEDDDRVHMAAGVIAALSPLQAWETNVALAERAFRDGEPSGHLGDALRKAARIMAGEDPLIVLPVDSKTYNFYRCIVDPTDAEAVVIDRHAHDVAVGERYGSRERGLSSKRRYATLAMAYRLAAQKLGEIPSVVQAVVWVVWRNKIATGGDQ